MPYSKASGKASNRYRRDRLKRVEVNYKIEYYEEHILPAIKQAGVQPATYFKQAIEEKIERDAKKKKRAE